MDGLVGGPCQYDRFHPREWLWKGVIEGLCEEDLVLKAL